MMDKVLRSISYIFHPLFVPLVGFVFYYYISPRFSGGEVIQAQLIPIVLLTILLPILMFFLLKTVGKALSIHLKTTKERIYPLALYCFILILVIKRVITVSQSLELYYFFVGVLLSNMICLTLASFKFKASIHMIGISGLLMFFVGLGMEFEVNITEVIAIMIAIAGALATSRLHLNAHTVKELIFGTFVGAVPQVMLFNYWVW